MDFSNVPEVRPAEIKTYHSTTYDRISTSNTTFDAKGKTVLITAGATGIGLQISTAFAKAGIARIIIIQRRASVLETAKRTLEASFPSLKIETHAASVSDFPAVTSILRAAGQIDILIPCATAFHKPSPTKTMASADLAESFTVNVVGLHHIVKEFLALPSTSSGGRKSVLHVSSNASQMPMAMGVSDYCASKAAANKIITHFALDEPEGNVKFYSFHPGSVWTPLAQENIPKEMVVWEDEKLSGDFAVWLASPEAEFLHGRYVWAAWDVDELVAMREKIAADPSLLTIGLAK